MDFFWCQLLFPYKEYIIILTILFQIRRKHWTCCIKIHWRYLLCFMTKSCNWTFIYLSKAIDCVYHEILLTKLKRYGVYTTLWDGSVVTFPTRNTLYPGIRWKLKSSNLNRGVPYGSILGPLLILIYMNYIVN